jgi:lysophospholipase L1-like esterase
VYLSLSGWFETITRFNQTLKRVAYEEHIRLVDLDSVVSGHPEYFRDFVHFTPEGHQKVAEAIHAGLQAKLPQRFASETSNAH